MRIDLDKQLDRLEAWIAEAEAQACALRHENSSLRAALEPSGAQGGAPNRSQGAPDSSAARPVRQIVLEAERQEIRSRLRSLLEAL